MRTLKRRWLITTFVFFLLSGVLLIDAVEHDPSINWVPIVDRRPDVTNAIEAAWQKTYHVDQITSEKVARIGKMLNNSLDVQEEEMKEGREKLEQLRHNSAHPSALSFFSVIPIAFVGYILPR